MARRVGILLVLAAVVAPSAAGAQEMRDYRTAGGTTIRIAGFPEAAQGFADFLAALPHGAELGSLKVTILAPAEVPGRCGDGMTACYFPRSSTIVVPGPRLDGPLLAHEYGHHIANHRPGTGLDPLLTGPPQWASRARVCARLRGTRIGTGWRTNPAEAWADVYARLVFPALPWRLSPLLRPREPGFAAALSDVLTPWTAPRTLTFHGRFGEGGSGVKRFVVPLSLDGEVGAEVDAERALRLDLRAAVGRRTSRTSRDRSLRFIACRTGDEAAVFSVRRREGNGPYRLTVRYPG